MQRGQRHLQPAGEWYDPEIAADPSMAPIKIIRAHSPYIKTNDLFHCPSNPYKRVHKCRNDPTYVVHGAVDNQHDPYYMSYRFYNSRLCGEVAPVRVDVGGMMAKVGYGCGDTQYLKEVGPAEVSNWIEELPFHRDPENSQFGPIQARVCVFRDGHAKLMLREPNRWYP